MIEFCFKCLIFFSSNLITNDLILFFCLTFFLLSPYNSKYFFLFLFSCMTKVYISCYDNKILKDHAKILNTK